MGVTEKILNPLPEGRSDAVYCSYPSPQNIKKTCKEIGTQVARANKEKSDITTKGYRKPAGIEVKMQIIIGCYMYLIIIVTYSGLRIYVSNMVLDLSRSILLIRQLSGGKNTVAKEN